MATVSHYLPTQSEYYKELKVHADRAEAQNYSKVKAVILLQRMARGYCIRKWIAWLSHNATIIQCAFRCHLARKAYRAALKRTIYVKFYKYYYKAARIVQSLWRGFFSRRSKFCYVSYRRWLRTIAERGERRAAEAAEFRMNSRADDLNILEEEAREWLAFVVFKLHHLLRTCRCSGVFSDPGTTELSEFEKLIHSIKYKDYMNRLRQKYEQFVKIHKPKFSNKKLFPVIGEGKDYWYLSLPELYEMTKPLHEEICSSKRHVGSHHGPMHKEPFLWRPVKYMRPYFNDRSRGPFTPQKLQSKRCIAPAPTPASAGDATLPLDPRYSIYVKHYKPDPDLLEYIDFHINAILKRKNSIQNIDVCDYPPTATTIGLTESRPLLDKSLPQRSPQRPVLRRLHPGATRDPHQVVGPPTGRPGGGLPTLRPPV